jgi:hypothetical protein
MALYIIQKNKEAISCHVNKHGKVMVPDMQLDAIEEIQADGHELDYIKNNFSGIPMCNKRLVIWRGPFAEFIYWNLEVEE